MALAFSSNDLLGKIEFHRLAKFRLEVDAPHGLYVQFFSRLKVHVILIDTGIHMVNFSDMMKLTIVLPQKITVGQIKHYHFGYPQAFTGLHSDQV